MIRVVVRTEINEVRNNPALTTRSMRCRRRSAPVGRRVRTVPFALGWRVVMGGVLSSIYRMLSRQP